MTEPNFIVTPDLYASKGKRIINLIIDSIGYYIFSFIIGILLGILELIGVSGILNYLETMNVAGSLIFGVIIVTSYFNIFEILTQRTLGKFISKTMVVLEDGSKPTSQDIILRSFCRLIPFEAFSFLGNDARGWHDSISNTYVVDIAKYEAKKKSQSELELIGKPQEDI